MKLHELSPQNGGTKKAKRIGRGPGSGWGKTSGKGHKGQKSRSGGGVRPGFEGGQMPLARRVPKRGFVNVFATEYAVINLTKLDLFDEGATVDTKALTDKGIIRDVKDGVKVLGNGKITKKLTVSLAAFSKTAKEKIEAAGGTTEALAVKKVKTKKAE